MTDSASKADRTVDFANPPVGEVSFGLQFETDVIDEVGTLASFWPEIKTEFPHHEKQPALPPATETFGVVPSPQHVQFQFLDGPPPQRYWFLSEDRTLIVQVQPDRLLFNWRRIVETDEYPHFDALAPRFESLIRTFLACIEERPEPPRVAWCELQYINPIEAGEPGGRHMDLSDILNFRGPDLTDEIAGQPEDTQLQQRYRLLGADGQPTGRFYLTAIPAVRTTDAEPLYVLTLLVRERPGAGAIPASSMEFMGRAHEMIVENFKRVTTPAMHERWGVK